MRWRFCVHHDSGWAAVGKAKVPGRVLVQVNDGTSTNETMLMISEAAEGARPRHP